MLKRAESVFYRWIDAHYPAITARYPLDAMYDHRRAFMAAHPEIRYDITALRKRWLAEVARDAGYSDVRVEEGFYEFWLARNDVEPYPEAVEALARLQGRFCLGAITNGNADVHHIGIGHYFDFVITAASAGVAKPAPAIFETALAAGGVTADETVYVGDDPEVDIRGASAAGLRTVWVNPSGQQWLGDLAPDAVIAGLGELEAVLAHWS